MEKLLFINACMRGAKLSRTYRLCRVFLGEYANCHPDFELEEVDLTRTAVPFYDGAAVIRRDSLIDEGKTDGETFRLARQFAQADKIVVGAPYWDLSFPAALKAYAEHISVRNVTFYCTPTGIAGMCRAEKLMYITTAGGYIAGMDLGFTYFDSLGEIYGIGRREAIRAEALDIEGNDTASIMRDAEQEAKAAAKLF